MKNYPLILASVILLILCFSCQDKETKPSYTVSAQIDGLGTGEAILTKLNISNNEAVYVDTAQIVDGKFTFKGSMETPYLHSIMLNGDRSKRIHFFLENSDISIMGNLDSLEKASIRGSVEDSIFRSYRYETIFEKPVALDIISKHNKRAFGVFTAFYLFQSYDFSLDTAQMIIDSFQGDAKNSLYYNHIDTLYQSMKRVAIGNEAPAFTIPDIEGTSVSLSDFRGQHVLLDFWASWCAPCRAQNPSLVKIYHQYKDRGFTIVGISVDKNREKWLKAVVDDELVWTNLSNAKGWDEVSKMYAIKAVPQNLLVDPDGIILAKNLTKESLGNKLEDILPQ